MLVWYFLDFYFKICSWSFGFFVTFPRFILWSAFETLFPNSRWYIDKIGGDFNVMLVFARNTKFFKKAGNRTESNCFIFKYYYIFVIIACVFAYFFKLIKSSYNLQQPCNNSCNLRILSGSGWFLYIAENIPEYGFYLIRISPYLNWIRETRKRILFGAHIPLFRLNTVMCGMSTHIPLFILNTGICGQNKNLILVCFT